MDAPLRLLLVEDSDDDACLVTRELSRGGWEVEVVRVETESALRESLAGDDFDIVVSDYRLPSLDGMTALNVVREFSSDLPFILVSGAVGEETAVALMRAGANDFISKAQLARLRPAVDRELEEAADRRARRRAEAALRTQIRQQESVTELGRRALQGGDVDRLMERVVESLAATLEVPLVRIAELQPDGRLRIAAGVGWRPEALCGEPAELEPRSIDSCSLGYDTLGHEDPLLVQDFAEETSCRATRMLRDHAVESGVQVCVDGYEGRFGLLGAFARAPRSFSQDDVHYVESVAHLLSMAIRRDRSEHKLRDGEAQLRSLLAAIPDLLFVVGAAGDLRAVISSDTFRLEHSTEALLGRKLREMLPPASADCLEQALAAVLETQLPQSAEYWVGEEESRRWLSARVVSLDTREDPKALFVARDVTEQRRAEAEREQLERQLRQVQKMEALGTLVGGIAHDFNNILTALRGHAELTRDHLALGTEGRDNVEEILLAANRAQGLVSQILAFSRQSQPQRRAVDVGEVLGEVLGLLRATLPFTIEVRQVVEEDLPAIEADPAQIHQVLMNLATNAYHAMREQGGMLELRLDSVEVKEESREFPPELAPGSYLAVTIRDTGHGMEGEVSERVFDPFFTTKGVGEGTGLGLAVVHGIVKNHGGAVRVESEIGRGTSFELFFPTSSSQAAVAAERSEPAAFDGAARVLFVDDEPAIVRVGSRLLSRLGHQCTTFTEADEALAWFREHSDEVDMVITDFTMPKRTGLSLAREMLAIRPELPVLVTTGRIDRLTPEQIREEGIRALLTKPFGSRDLALAVADALGERSR